MNDTTAMPGMPSMEQPTETTQPETNVNVEANDTIKEDSVQAPKLHSHETTISNSLENVMIPKGGIKVVALRKGFYNQNRLSKGAKFTVKSFDELGLWMRCEDSDLEKKRVQFLKEKKARK